MARSSLAKTKGTPPPTTATRPSQRSCSTPSQTRRQQREWQRPAASSWRPEAGTGSTPPLPWPLPSSSPGKHSHSSPKSRASDVPDQPTMTADLVPRESPSLGPLSHKCLATSPGQPPTSGTSARLLAASKRSPDGLPVRCGDGPG